MDFKNSSQRKAYFAKNKDAGWHFKDSHGTHVFSGTHSLNKDGKTFSIAKDAKKHAIRDREQQINGDYYKGQPFKEVVYASGSPTIMRGIGKLKQYDKRHGHGQKRYSGGAYSGGSIWGSSFKEHGLHDGVRPEFIAHKTGKTVKQVRDEAMYKKTNNFKMFD